MFADRIGVADSIGCCISSVDGLTAADRALNASMLPEYGRFSADDHECFPLLQGRNDSVSAKANRLCKSLCSAISPPLYNLFLQPVFVMQAAENRFRADVTVIL